MSLIERWQQAAHNVRRDAFTLWLACRDPRTSRLTKALGAFVLAYALSPLDLIPDFLPVLGSIDDLLIIPAGLVLVRRTVPAPVLTSCRQEASRRLDEGDPTSRWGAVLVAATWAAVLSAVVWGVLRLA